MTAGTDLRPMKAVSGEIPTGDGWAFEVKWDGMRVLAEFDGESSNEPRRGVTAVSTNGLDVTSRFPELFALGARLAEDLPGRRLVLDGEVVAFDAQGRTDFGMLQPRMHATGARAAGAQAAVPVTFVVFDLLHFDQPTVSLPYLDRRRLLTDLVDAGPSWMVPAHRIGDGQELFEAAAAQGLEGIMAKRIDSPYLPGRRSSAWLKCKVRHRQEVVIGGWTKGTGHRANTLGALHVGVHDQAAPGNPLRYAGKVGTGLTDAMLTDLHAALSRLATDGCPFDPPPPSPLRRGSTWVDPVLVAEVEFAHWTTDGNLRHPSYLGLRMDRDPSTVVREPGPGGT